MPFAQRQATADGSMADSLRAIQYQCALRVLRLFPTTVWHIEATIQIHFVSCSISFDMVDLVRERWGFGLVNDEYMHLRPMRLPLAGFRVGQSPVVVRVQGCSVAQVWGRSTESNAGYSNLTSLFADNWLIGTCKLKQSIGTWKGMHASMLCAFHTWPHECFIDWWMQHGDSWLAHRDHVAVSLHYKAMHQDLTLQIQLQDLHQRPPDAGVAGTGRRWSWRSKRSLDS